MLLSLLTLFAGVPRVPLWTLETDDTRLILTARPSGPVVLSLGEVHSSRSWTQESPETLFETYGVHNERAADWNFENAEGPDRASALVLRFRSRDGRLLLASIWRARPGPGPIEHWTEITNLSGADVAVPQQESLALTGLDPGGPAQAWWIRRGASNALSEGGVFQNPVDAQLDLNLVNDHHDPRSPVPWIAVQQGSDHGLYAGWEFSGKGRVAAKGMQGGRLNLNIGLMPEFKTDITPGETLKLPAAFVGCYRGDIDEGANRLHRFVSRYLRAPVPKSFPDPALLYNLYLDAGADHAKEANVLASESLTKQLGFEVFMPDAMWFPACGDWRWDPARFPAGVKPIEVATHRDGMKLGLWCAWNNGGISTDSGALSVRGPVGHPDWFPFDLPANWQPGPFYGASACMASEEAKQWAISKTQAMVGDWKLDMLKTDVHPMINECTRTDHRHRYGTDVGYWSALGVYEVWDRLRARFPNLVLENCSGASHIKDFGVIQRCAYTVVTDTLSNLPDRCGIYDSTYLLPPSALLTYTYENGYGLPGDDPGPYLCRSAMMTAWEMDPTNSSAWTEEQRASVAQCVRDYKSWLRPILRDCKVHHVLPRPDGKHWDGMFFWSSGLGRGALFAFRPDSEVPVHSIKLAGLEPARSYRVWCEDGSLEPFQATGSSLMDSGVKLHLPGKYTCDLIHVQEASRPLPGEFMKPKSGPQVHPRATGDYYGTNTDLSWAPIPGARSYRVLVSSHTDFSDPTVDDVVYAPRWSRLNLQGDGLLYARVDALNWGGAAKGTPLPLPTAQRQVWGGEFVSDLPWQSATIGVPEGPHRDKNHYGNELSIGGHACPKGIWTHSFDDGRPSDIVFDVVGKGYESFNALVGLDDASGGGSVQFQVLVDGVVRADTPVLHPKESRRLTVPLSGAKVVTLRVLNGGDGYTSDHAVWGMARFIRTGAKDPFE